jgi:hypothetical protein
VTAADENLYVAFQRFIFSPLSSLTLSLLFSSSLGAVALAGSAPFLLSGCVSVPNLIGGVKEREDGKYGQHW